MSAFGAFLAIIIALPLLAILIARLVVIQVPVDEAPAVDFEFGPLEPGSITTQQLGDLGVTASGIALPALAIGGDTGVDLRFRLLAGDGSVLHEELLDVAWTQLEGDRSDVPGTEFGNVRFQFQPLETPIHGAVLQIEAAGVGDARVFLGATKEDALPAGRLSYQGAELHPDQDLRVGVLRSVTVWRLLAELRHSGPTGFVAAVVLGFAAVLVLATAGATLLSRSRPPTPA